VPMNDLEALKKAISPFTCAVMLEPIQGESGIYLATAEYIKGVRKLCDDTGILLIFDEVQCGLGRTGKLFGYQHFDVEPDVLTLAKALGGGFPIGALLAKEHVASAFEKGDHGSTFGGNPLACAAGIAAMDAILSEGLVENSRIMGDYLMRNLKVLSSKYPVITEVRGKGLMIGIQLSTGKAETVRDICFEKGYLVGNVGSDIIRLLPPLIVEKADIDRMTEVLGDAVAIIS
jgi:acetylornithine/N-succinyldiaminopimelate aminotransferase